MKRRMGRTVLGLAIVAALSAAALATTARSTPHARPGGPPPPAWLATLAGRMAFDCRDASPTSAMYCRTTRGAAGPAVGEPTGDVQDSRRPVYLIVLVGQFIDAKAFTPPGVGAPHGTVITFTADLRTHTVLDFGLGDRRPSAPRDAHWSRFAIPASLTGQASGS